MKASGSLGRRLLELTAVILMIAAWKIASAAIGKNLVLPPPEDVAMRMAAFMAAPSYWSAVLATIQRGITGFGLAAVAGLAVGIAAGRSTLMRSFLTPFLVVMQSVPVMSVIILAIIWFSTDNVAVFSVFLMTLPIVAIGTEEGIRAMDPGLLKMAAIYRLNRSQRLLSIILPSVVPFVVAGLNASLALTWKVVVAAEVLAQPLHAVGTGMALAKVRLETEAVMAWTLTAVVLSGVSHFVFAIVRKAFHWRMDAGESG